LLLAQALPTVLAVVAGIAFARWLGLLEPRGADRHPWIGRRRLAGALGAGAVLVVFVLVFYSVG
jgi:hypothetical protein